MESKRTFNVPNFQGKTVFQTVNLNVGRSIPGNVPNIKGWFPSIPGIQTESPFGGVFKNIEILNTQGYGGSYYNIVKTSFDASLASSVYSNTKSIVIPASNIVNFCIRY